MNPTLHRPLSIDVSPTELLSEEISSNQFNIGMRYSPNGNTQTFLCVHVPKTLQPALLSGQVNSIHLETLEVNSVTARGLGGHPNYLALGLTTRSGEELEEIPSSLQWARRHRLVLGSLACLLGTLAVFSTHAWIGAIFLILGSHAIRTAQQIPHNPFYVFKEHR
jgi:hypothetical protein